MKRKLDDDNIPQPNAVSPISDTISSFEKLGLDARLLQGIKAAKFSSPTPIQARAIPLALDGKDIIARSKTGSGKTAAYVIPVLQQIVKRKNTPANVECVSSLILVPTKELASQITRAVSTLTTYCASEVKVENISRKEDDSVQRARLTGLPDVVVATPGRAAAHLSTGALSLTHLSSLVIDEADLVLSYGYEDDLSQIAHAVPNGVQLFLMSATLRAEVNSLKNLFARDPVVLELDEEEKAQDKISQFVVRCGEDEKFLLIYAIFKLNLIKGKCIIFVADIDRCYRLKLYLEQFGVRSCVLNSELPVNSRIHVVEEFNKNVYDIIIATDEDEVIGDEVEPSQSEPKGSTSVPVDGENQATNVTNGDADLGTENIKNNNDGSDPQNGDAVEPRKKKRKPSKRDKEYGIARGIDFKNVACILNFDLPTTSKSYTHRIGRTARAGRTGMALSFVIPCFLYRKHKPTSIPSCEHDEDVLAKITTKQEKRGNAIQPYHFDMDKLAGFKYRMVDALRAVTRLAVREARTRELRQELLKSEKLKRHFEENPTDLHHLRHDGELRAARTQAHLKHVPGYLLPAGARQPINKNIGFVGVGRTSENRIRKARTINSAKGRGKGKKAGLRKPDPLKTFRVKGRHGKKSEG